MKDHEFEQKFLPIPIQPIKMTSGAVNTSQYRLASLQPYFKGYAVNLLDCKQLILADWAN